MLARHSALLLGCLAATAPAWAGHYGLTRLGTGQTLDAHFSDLNNAGVGTVNMTDPDRGPVSCLAHLGQCSPAPAGFFQIKGINDHGVISGTVWGARLQAFKYENGAMRDLGSLGADAEAGKLNNSGVVAGIALTGTGAVRAVTFDGKGVNDLGTLGGNYSAAQDINDSGAVVGMAATAGGNEDQHAFLYQDGVMHDLGTLAGGSFSSAQCINAAGMVAGYGDVAGRYRAFVYSGGAMAALTVPERAWHSYAMGMNDAGSVVGMWRTESGASEAYLYDGVTLAPLDALLANAPGWRVTDAYDINNSGQIAARACHAESGCELVLLSVTSPTPEAASYAMLLAGLGVLGAAGLRRRRGNG